MKSVFNKVDVTELTGRINNLTTTSAPIWGKMTVGQMLAHCNVAYEMVYTDKYPKPNPFMKFILKAFVKETVVGPKPYKHNSPTAPAFIIKEEKDMEQEKGRLLVFLDQTLDLGEAHFDKKESNAFGPLTTAQWNTMFYKHLDHHLGQFGV